MANNYSFRTWIDGGMGFGCDVGKWRNGLPTEEDFPMLGGIQMKETVFLPEYNKEVIINEWEFSNWKHFMKIFKLS